jgi:hypothetical protein
MLRANRRPIRIATVRGLPATVAHYRMRWAPSERVKTPPSTHEPPNNFYLILKHRDIGVRGERTGDTHTHVVPLSSWLRTLVRLQALAPPGPKFLLHPAI